MDKLTREQRSANMAAIRGKNTKPEMTVRRFLHRRGLRYRLHDKTLPGKPDLVFSGRRVVVFVHGCFWHGCPHCAAGLRKVKSNAEYWKPKLARNRRRDAHSKLLLETDGWKVLTVWECQLRGSAVLEKLAGVLNRTPGRRPSRC
jgi:DNA mismatch endonuclease, patch repair protein